MDFGPTNQQQTPVIMHIYDVSINNSFVLLTSITVLGFGFQSAYATILII